MTLNGSKWPKNDISEMSRFTRFARHKFSAARHLKLFCTPDYYYHPFLSSVSGYIDNRSTRSRQGKGWWNIWNDTRKNQVSMNYVQGRWLQKRIVPTRVYPRKYIITHRETSVSSFSWKIIRINFFNIRAGFRRGKSIHPFIRFIMNKSGIWKIIRNDDNG